MLEQKILLIRHTKPAIAASVCYGQLDVEPAAGFESEALAVWQKIENIKVDAVFTSPLKRCSELANFLFSDKQMSVDVRLKEIDFGAWENKEWNAIAKPEMDFWCKDFIHHAPYGGENFMQLYDRSLRFFDEIATSKGTIAVVTHAGVIRSVLADVLQVPLTKVFNLKLSYGAVVELCRLDEDNFSVDFL